MFQLVTGQGKTEGKLKRLLYFVRIGRGQEVFGLTTDYHSIASSNTTLLYNVSTTLHIVSEDRGLPSCLDNFMVWTNTRDNTVQCFEGLGPATNTREEQ